MYNIEKEKLPKGGKDCPKVIFRKNPYKNDGKGAFAVKNDMIGRNLPPVIRIFISSTFSDMEKERTYFNEVLVPRFNRICAARGVSFFSVDLRWGITEEEQVDGQVLPICLGEIDKCRPFFIGILGNRYGSVLEEVPAGLGESIPWIVGKEGKSITELEMLYAVLDKEKNEGVKNCAFYFRDDELSTEWYGESKQDEKLSELKSAIRGDGDLPVSDYSTLEEFGERVTADILAWLDNEFPVPEKINEVRRQWYNSELLRNYIPDGSMHRFMDSYFSESNVPLLITGDGSRGKTTLLTAWEPENGEKILINCASDDAFIYWPTIANEIVRQINVICPNAGEPEGGPKVSKILHLISLFKKNEEKASGDEFFFVSDEERERYRVAFVKWLSSLSVDKHIYIVINDMNLLEDDASLLFSWLPQKVSEHIHIVCSTNNYEMISNAEAIGWNCKEMPLFDGETARRFVLDYLHGYGKNLSDAQLSVLLTAKAAQYPGDLRFACDFLINCGRFHNLNQLIDGIAAAGSIEDTYKFVFEYNASSLDEKEQSALRYVFGILRYVRMSLGEQECFELVNRMVDINAISWAKLRNIVEQFSLIMGDYWNMRDEELKSFTNLIIDDEEYKTINSLLGAYMMEKLYADDGEEAALQSKRKNTAAAKAALYHYGVASEWEKLKETLSDHQLLSYLSRLDWQAVRVAWMKIFLYSDIDIPEVLLGLLRKYCAPVSRNNEIATAIARLFKDLLYYNYTDQVAEILGTNNFSSSIHSDFSQLSNEFLDVYNALADAHQSGDRRRLYTEVCKLLEMGKDFNAMDRCMLLFFKADCESALRLKNECLETTNLYYRAAILASSVYDIERAISMRGNALYFAGRYKEAFPVLRQCLGMAEREGNLLDYLAIENILAMIDYRLGLFDHSYATFDRLHYYWTKVGNESEAASVRLNKCNALHVSGRDSEARDEAKRIYDDLGENATGKLFDIRVSALSNMGMYSKGMGDYDTAVSCLLEAIEKAEEAKLEVTAINSTICLIEIYKEQDNFIAVVEAYDKLLELLWVRREFERLAKNLNEYFEFLHIHQYATRANKLKKAWEERFSAIPGGKEFLESQLSEKITDSRKIDKLKEDIAMAKSSGDYIAAAEISRRIAMAISRDNKDEAIVQLFNSYSFYKLAGNGEEAENRLMEAMFFAVNNGKVRNQEFFDKIMSLFSREEEKKIVELWLGNSSSAPEKAEEENKSDIMSLINKFKNKSEAETEKKSSCKDRMLQVSLYGRLFPILVQSCFIDMTEDIIRDCSHLEILSLVNCLPDDFKDEFVIYMVNTMGKHCEEDISYLRKDYASSTADKKLEYYEKCIKVFIALDEGDVPGTAGNISIIFRRRKEKEKALYYHQMSMEGYKKQNKTKDALIEMLNIATVYREFGEFDRAIELLRDGIKVATEAKEESLKAAMAGNLAAILTNMEGDEVYDEAMRCFAIEEGFYRGSGNDRDLAISLINQIIFCRRRNKDYGDRLKEAGKIIRRGGFKEFEGVLVQLETDEKRKGMMDNSDNSAGGEKKSTEAVEKGIKELLAIEDYYTVGRESVEENGAYHAVCYPKKGSAVGAENLHILATENGSLFIDLIYLFQPKMKMPDCQEGARQFVDWWNQQGIYALEFMEEAFVLQANFRFTADSWEEAAQKLAASRKFWQADIACMSMISIGVTDLKTHQDIKLKVLNGEEN